MLMTKLEYIFLEIHVALPLFYPPKDSKQIVQLSYIRGTQQEYSSKPLKHSIVERISVFKR